MKEAKHIFIVNPAAGPMDQTAQASEEIIRCAERLGIDFEIHRTDYQGHASRLVLEAGARWKGRPLRFYACGGDGTLNEVAQSVIGMKNAAAANYPIGSGNDFNKIFGLDHLDRFHSLEALIQGKPLTLDYLNSECGVSLNIFSVGIDAEVARAMSRYKRLPGLHGKGSYYAATLERVIRGVQQQYRVEVDGRNYDGRYCLVLAANGRYYGGSFYAVPEADPSDGWMDVLLVKGISRLRIAAVIGAYQKGRHRDYPDIITHIRAKTLRIGTRDNRLLTVNRDGEIVQVKEIGVSLIPGGLRYIVPEGVTVEGVTG